MLIVNLDENFAPFGKSSIIIKNWQFPCLEHGLRIESDICNYHREDFVKIVCRLRNSDDIIRLSLLNDAFRRKNISNLDLFISYLCYARNDRVMTDGESFSLKVIANILNSLNFRHIEIFDCHSTMSTALINNSVNITNHKFVKKILEKEKEYLLVAPDFGSSKKIYELAKYLNYTKETVLANKVRYLSTGKIVDTAIISDKSLEGKNCIIVDDIISRGGTFIGLAKKLKELGAASVKLIVSHCEWTHNIKDLFGPLDQVITTNSFQDYIYFDGYSDKIKCVSLSQEIL